VDWNRTDLGKMTRFPSVTSELCSLTPSVSRSSFVCHRAKGDEEAPSRNSKETESGDFCFSSSGVGGTLLRSGCESNARPSRRRTPTAPCLCGSAGPERMSFNTRMPGWAGAPRPGLSHPFGPGSCFLWVADGPSPFFTPTQVLLSEIIKEHSANSAQLVVFVTLPQFD